MAQKGKKKQVAKSSEPLPGRQLLKLFRAYSEDSNFQRRASPRINEVLEDYQAPPAEIEDENAQEINSSQGNKEPTLCAELEERPSNDDLYNLLLAEENSDDAKSGSSNTGDFSDAKPHVDDPDDSCVTESESTGSGTNVALDDLSSGDLSEHSTNEDSGDFELPTNQSETNADGNSGATDQFSFQAELRPTKVQYKKKPLVSWRASDLWRHKLQLGESQAEFIVRRFSDILGEKKDPSGPLSLTIQDLLDTNLDFEAMDSQVIARLRSIASNSSSPNRVPQRLKDFEEFMQLEIKKEEPKKAVPVGKLLKNDKPPQQLNPDERPRKQVEKPVNKPKMIPKKYPTESDNEGLPTKFYRKAFVSAAELRATIEEQDVWVTEETPDLSFIESRRENILRGLKVPIGEKDYEVDVLSTHLARQALEFEAAVNQALPENRNRSEILPEDELNLPRKPLIPVCVDPNEDPDDEDTTSDEEGVPGKGKKAKSSRARKAYKVVQPKHEDDQYDYYNSDRSSSEYDSVNEVIRKKVEQKILEAGQKTDTVSAQGVLNLEVVGGNHKFSLPLKRIRVDDLYALAHDLHMPPSQLRKELMEPGDSIVPIADEDVLMDLQSQFLYEKQPEFYAVQINDLQNKLHLLREQWIVLDMEYQEFSIKTRTQSADTKKMGELLMDESKREVEKITKLNVTTKELAEELERVTEYQNMNIAYLTNQRDKTKERLTNRSVFLRSRLFALGEYVEKQHQMEARMAVLRKEEHLVRKTYQLKVSKMLRDSARNKEQLFRDYKMKVKEVFVEYQRALELSMNDNLQQACTDHIEGRRRAKRFSTKALEVIQHYNNLNIKMEKTQQTTDMAKELLILSKNHSLYIERQHEQLLKQFDERSRKLEQLEQSLNAAEITEINKGNTLTIAKKNTFLQQLIWKLEEEKSALMWHLNAESHSNQQMENHINWTVRCLQNYLEYQVHYDPDKPKSVNMGLIETFEDQLICFLHYATEIEDLIVEERNKRKLLISDGDLGLIPKKKRGKT